MCPLPYDAPPLSCGHICQRKVIEHYTPMIDEMAVDEDMKQHLIMKLLEELPHFPMEQE